MKCPICGAAELIHGTQDIPYLYKGKKTKIPAVTGDFCQACGEGVLNKAEGDRVNKAMLEFNKQVNGEAIDPQYIAKVREKLELDQKQAAELFGGGVNAFSRYETGRATPPTALLKLFKILDKYPQLLGEIADKPLSSKIEKMTVTIPNVAAIKTHKSRDAVVHLWWNRHITKTVELGIKSSTQSILDCGFRSYGHDLTSSYSNFQEITSKVFTSTKMAYEKLLSDVELYEEQNLKGGYDDSMQNVHNFSRGSYRAADAKLRVVRQ